MRIRITPLGKASLLLVVIIVISGFTLTDKDSNATIDPPAKKGSITFLKTTDPKDSFENLINAYSLQANPEELLKKIHLTIYFPPDNAEIRKEYYQTLDIFAKVANSMKNTIIQVEGNTANPADDKDCEFDKSLSLKRAQVIADYLIKKGVKSEKLVIYGNGSSRPVGNNKTKDGRKTNRRSEVFFKDISKVVRK